MPTHQNDVFRFVAQRPVQRVADKEVKNWIIPADLTGHFTALSANKKAMSLTEAADWAKGLQVSEEFVSSIADLKVPIAALDQWLLEQGNRAKPEHVINKLKELLKLKPEDLVQSELYKVARRMTVISLAALTVLPSGKERLRNQLLRSMYIFGLIERLAWEPQSLQTEEDVEKFLAQAVVLLPADFPSPADALARPPAIADLKVVRQRLLRYEMGEVAHIENVLKGETLQRIHSRSTTREETVTTAIEREEIREQDLQSTSRFEMQNEASSIAKEDEHFEAGITVSASYGPTVSATANAGYESNYAKEESKKTAMNYAREVIEKTASRIREKVTETRTVRTLVQTEEKNTHTIDNSDKGEHVTGVYRWVDKIYEAQVYNYGKRLMLEFVVPEPAAFVKYVMEKQAAPNLSIEKPEPPTVLEQGNPRPLRPSDITADNYMEWVAKYYVRDASTPPAATKWLSVAWDDPSKPEVGVTNALPGRKLYKVNKELEIPDGYYAAKFTGTLHVTDFKENIFLTAGSMDVPLTEYRRGAIENSFSSAYSLDKDFQRNETGKLPIALTIDNCWGYDISIMIQCQLFPQGLQKWQLETYEKIMSAYVELKSIYDEEAAAAETRKGIAIKGKNPFDNRITEKTELKKNVIAMLEQQHFNQAPVDQDAIQTGPEQYPEVNFQVAQRERDYIQWFEQAFEWQQMTYVLYPYYWNKKQNWVKETQIDDVDPIFSAFLKAGAARVAVPVRPGFENAISLYLATGVIWDGNQVPQVGDALYVSLIQEIQEQQDAAPGGLPEGEPWEVKLPTSLVILQQNGELPA